MKWSRLVLAVCAAALIAWGWVLLHPSIESVIRKRLDSVARSASFGSNQGYLAKAAGAEKLTGYCASNVDLQIDLPWLREHRLAGREEIEQAVLASRATIKGLSVAFPDATITVSGDRQSAVADATLQVKIAGESDVVVQELKITFRLIEGEWLIVKVESVRTLSMSAHQPEISRAA